MNRKNNILFVINPISGIGKQKIIEKLVDLHIDKFNFNYVFKYTEYRNHATEIAKLEKDNFDIIVAVGGDGSINEIADSLINSNTKLAVIPTGSGNGFARHMKIPLNLIEAIRLINKNNAIKIDTCSINNHTFVNVAGIGFDGFISHLFSKQKKRGFGSYIKLVSKHFRKYPERKFELTIDNNKSIVESFMLSIANSSQFGNNVKIAPSASVTDGLFDIVILKKFSILSTPILAYRLFNNTISNSKYINHFQAKKMILKSSNLKDIHIDGEPIIIDSDCLEIEIKPKSLNVIVDNI